MRAIVFAGAFVLALWLFGRRTDPAPTTGWRDLERVDSV